MIALSELLLPAPSLAHALDLSVYDALYTALAQRLRCALATAEERLARSITASGIAVTALLIR
jgi:predicted nucleic acid-binding protein